MLTASTEVRSVRARSGAGTTAAGPHNTGLEHTFIPGDMGQPERRTEPDPRSAPPQRATNFIGRRHELAALRRLLNHSQLITLVGPGGAGKTRLATELAAKIAPRFPDGVIFVDLTAVNEQRLVVNAVANAVGVMAAARNRVDAISEHLRDRAVLLIMDNCEHLVAACAGIASELRRHCPSLTQVATSRERLNIEGETVWAVPPLSLPPSADMPAADASDAVRLFVDRARLVQPAFALGEGNVAHVVEVCRSIDGIPLAIELAAARLATTTPAELEVLLTDRLGTLVGGGRDVVERQQTLRATIAWSYELLSDDQRLLFRRLAVFAGGQFVDAIREVCAFPPLGPDRVRDLVTQLVEKSVVWVRQDGDAMRFGMLEPVREFAGQQLEASGEQPALAARHHALYTRLAAEAWEARRWAGARSEHRRLRTEIDDVRAALDASDSATAYMQMATDLFWVWMEHAPHEGARRLSDAFERLPDPPPALLARAGRILMACGGQTGDYSMYDAIVPRINAAIESGVVEDERGHHALQEGFHRQRLGGDLIGARESFRAALAAFETQSPGPDLVLVSQALGSVERQLGNMEAARRLITDALERGLRIDDPYGTIGAYFHRGWLDLDEGDNAGARASFLAGLELADGSDRLSLAHQIEGIACAVAGSDPRRAARLFGAAEVLREQTVARLQPPWQPRVERGIAEARAPLGERAWERERAAGRELTVEATIRTAHDAGPSSEPRRGGGGLSRREAEVARLVAAGMTNRSIAAKLFLSERTVESHIDHILTKLAFTSRAQLAAWVAAGQL